MSLPSVPLVPTANNPQGVGHPNTVTGDLTATGSVNVGQVLTALGATITGGFTVGTGPSLFGGDITMTTPGATATLTNARITALLSGSLSASAPVPVTISNAGTGWTVGVFSGWRVVVGSTPVSGSASPTNYSLLWSTLAGTVGTATPFSGRPNVYVQSSSGSDTFFSVIVNGTTGFSGQCINSGGAGVDGINGMYLAIGPA